MTATIFLIVWLPLILGTVFGIVAIVFGWIAFVSGAEWGFLVCLIAGFLCGIAFWLLDWTMLQTVASNILDGVFG